MSVTVELAEVYLMNHEEVSPMFNRITKEVVSKDEDGECVVIPQISSSEAYDLMVNFAKEQDGEAADQLLEMLQEKKPINKFKTQLNTLELGDKWYEYENKYAMKIMTEWLDQNK